MGALFAKKNIVFSLLVALLLFVSCSTDTDIKVSGVDSFIVFDYESEDSLPLVRLSVFAETSSDVHRVERIKILSRETSYEWTVDEPVIIESESRQWAGTCDFVCPEEIEFPSGFYTLTYTDASDNEIETAFSISYPDDLMGKNAKEAAEFLHDDAQENIALYDENDILIYYGIYKDSWQDDSRLFAENNECVYYRRCVSLGAFSAFCLMPAVYKDVSTDE